MNEDTIRLVTIGRILRRRWRLLAVLAVAGALFGYGTSVLLLPPRYTAEASVLLPGQWEERELLTQVDIATSSAVVDRAADALDWRGVNGTELQKDVSAKADDGNIIKVSGTADTPERAQRLSDQLAQQFVTFATRIAGGSTDPAADTATEALRKQVAETNRRITDLADSADPGQTVESVQARTELEGLRTGLQDAMKKLEEANPASAKASMVVMGRPPADRSGGADEDAAHRRRGAAVLRARDRRPSRRRTGEPPAAHRTGDRRGARLAVPRHRRRARRTARAPAREPRLAGPAPPPSRHRHPVGHTGPAAVRRRGRAAAPLPARVHPPPGPTARPRRLLVVVPEGDEVARLAAGQLVAEASGDPRLRVVEVSVDRPIVPDRDTESGALAVLSAGSWTAGELAGIAEACADGGHELVGVVVAGTVRTRPTETADRLSDDATLTFAVHGHATGDPA